MTVLGNYSIDITTNQTYVSKSILPFFCNKNVVTPCLDAYFQNINLSERAEVEKMFLTAIHNLSNFDVVHFIKSSYKILKIKNQGKAFLQSNSKLKKITGTITSINQSDAIELNSNNSSGEIFELEILLNSFIKQQKQKAGKAKINLFLKMDSDLPKYTIGFPKKIISTLQTAFDKIINSQIVIEEVILAVKLIRESKTGFTVNFALEFGSNQSTFYSFDTLLKNTEIHPELNENNDTVNQTPLNASTKILLAEDHKMNQKIAINLLKKEFKGVEVDIAENGFEAYEMVKNNTYNLVLMDINMPLLDGINATKKIRTELKSEIPILAFSAHVFLEQIQNCFIAGMNDFIAKPIDIDNFRLKIKNALKYNIEKESNQPILKNLYNHLDNVIRIAV